MIQYSEDRYKPDLKALWKICFPEDTDLFITFYFNEIYKNDETLICLEDHQPVAALQIIPYSIKTGNHIRKGGYLSGIMTHPAYRKRGYMDKLLNASFDEMKKKSYDYTFLIPQEKELAVMYAKYGFRLCESNPQPPVNRVLKTPRQWAAIRQNFFDENGVWLKKEPDCPGEHKGMIQRLNPAVEEITTLSMGMMLD
ncbi:MAG: GNAT family N-acetyltransferase [Dysgonamonadaceae bacterium]|jgi:predicted acetyltransferase|nr:GNAT family N-acetyltransferase [Dysgonamonadaceae bacterium]